MKKQKANKDKPPVELPPISNADVAKVWSLLSKKLVPTALEAGKLIVKMLGLDITGSINKKRRLEVYIRLAKQADTPAAMSEGMFDALVNVGRGRMHPMLFLDLSKRSHTLAKMPIEAQTTVIEKGWHVSQKDGTAPLLRYTQMSLRDVMLICGPGGLRDVSEQLKIITTADESVKEARKESQIIGPVEDGRFRVFGYFDEFYPISKLAGWLAQARVNARTYNPHKKRKQDKKKSAGGDADAPAVA